MTRTTVLNRRHWHMFQSSGPTLLPLLLLGALASQPGCGQLSDSGAECQSDRDCAELCSRIGECLSAEHAIELRIRWSVNGVVPSPAQPAACGVIADFEVRLDSASRRDEPIAYFPTPCELGQVFYDRMPDRLSELRLTAHDAQGNALDSKSRAIEDRTSEFLIDFAL